jgi:hypothetical protein
MITCQSSGEHQVGCDAKTDSPHVPECPVSSDWIAESEVQKDSTYEPLNPRYLRSCRYANRVAYYRIKRKIYYQRQDLDALLAGFRVPAGARPRGVRS